MERILYDRMAEHDSTHWWYRARRDVLASVIERKVTLPSAARILEIGCGTGHNIPMLARFGEVDAIEIDAAAGAVASRRLGRKVFTSPLPELAGVPEGVYDMVALLDVLEHVVEDKAALASVARRLKPNGTVLLTVPQFAWMWSGHDVANHHHRRYSKASLRRVMDAAGLQISMLQSFNSLLFPLALADRAVAKVTGREGSDDAQPAAPLNALFQGVFGLERFLVGKVPMPPGLSLIALASVHA